MAASLTASLAACGGEKSERDVEALIDRAFRKSVRSADVNLDAQIAVAGSRGFERPVRIQASGPYIVGKGALPRVDLDLTIGAQGAGQTVQAGLLSTGDRAFVKFGGAFYERAREDVERANRKLRRGRRAGGGSLRRLGLDPRRWVVDARDEGVERVGGVDTRHVSGRLDSRSLFRDLNGLVERYANAVGGRKAGVPGPLTSDDVDRLAKVVRSPSFDVYVGSKDGIVRRVSASLEVRVPQGARARVDGIEGGSLRFSLELADVNGDQEVQAPIKSRPIGDLTKQLGGLRALGEQTGRGGGGTQPGPPDATGGAGGALRRYSDCLDEAGPNDTKALARCAELLR